MKLLIPPALFFLAMGGTVQGQTPPQTIDSYVGAAKVAAGTEWAGTFLRLCISTAGCQAAGPPASRPGGLPAGNRAIPARETWYAEPAKVADNLGFYWYQNS